MIVGLFGKQGSGKSLLEALLARRLVVEGALAFSNTPMEGFTVLEELRQIPRDSRPKVLVIDEAMLFLDSRSFKSEETQDFTQFLLFCRKWSICLIYSTNAPHQIDKRLRDLTQYFILCRRNGARFEYLFVDGLTLVSALHVLPACDAVFQLANYDTRAVPTSVQLAGALSDLGFRSRRK